MLIGWVLVIVSYWKPVVSRTYMTYYLIAMMLRWSAPQDAGWYMNLQTSNEAWIGVAMFSFGYIKMDFVSHVILFSHLMLFMKPTIYRAETAKTSVWAPAVNFLF